MANFKVGDRVRVVGSENDLLKPLIGMSGTITGEYLWDGIVTWHLDIPPPVGVGKYSFASWHLAPLTDPSAERFIESIKKLGREPINDAPKVNTDIRSVYTELRRAAKRVTK